MAQRPTADHQSYSDFISSGGVQNTAFGKVISKTAFPVSILFPQPASGFLTFSEVIGVTLKYTEG
jgi:hypothetical protein